MSYLQLEIVDRCFPVQRIQYQKMHLHLRIQCKSTPELSSVHIVIADLQIEHSSIYVDINNWKLMTFSRMYHSWKKCLAVTNMHVLLLSANGKCHCCCQLTDIMACLLLLSLLSADGKCHRCCQLMENVTAVSWRIALLAYYWAACGDFKYGDILLLYLLSVNRKCHCCQPTDIMVCLLLGCCCCCLV